MEKNKPWWDPITKVIKQATSPVTVTAAALTLGVVWALQPILLAQAAEVRSAIINPNSEPDPHLRPLATLAHRVFFTEIVLVCEILLIGAIAVLLVKFVFYVIRSVARETRRTRRELGSFSRPRAHVTPSTPKVLPSATERPTAPKQRALEAPKEKKVYLIPGPKQIQDTREPSGATDGSME